MQWKNYGRKIFRTDNCQIMKTKNYTNIKRREAIRRTAILMGGAVSAPTLLGIMNGCSPTNESVWVPQFFNENQAGVITSMVDIIIPSGDIPGAVAAGIPSFVDSMVGKVYDPESQQIFLDGLNGFMQAVEEDHDKAFPGLNEEIKFAIITAMNEEMVSMDDPNFFRFLKELTIIGYCRSEVGATQLLQYDKVPNEYLGCIPLVEVGRAWAT